MIQNQSHSVSIQCYCLCVFGMNKSDMLYKEFIFTLKDFQEQKIVNEKSQTKQEASHNKHDKTIPRCLDRK